MRSSTMFGIAMGSALANAQNRFCSSYSRPKWDDCQVVIEDFGFEGGDEILHENGRDDPAPSCKWWYREGGNCRITHCFEEEINDDPDDPRQRSGAQLFPFYEQIRSQCVPFRAGGEFTGAFEFLNVLNDEDESGNPPSRRTVRRGNGLVEGHLSLEEYREWLNDTLPAEAHREREDSQLLGARESKHAQLNEKRQDDEEWVDVKFEVVGTRNPNQFERGPRLGSGVGLKYESQSSTSFGVTSTVSLGASWDIFTASVGLEMSQTDTYTVTEGLTFDVDCPNQGQVTFWPYYDYFEVTFQPSGRDAEIWVPVEAGNKEISGEITVACVG